MKINGINTIFPSFVMHGVADEMTAEDNTRLSDLSWEIWKRNESTEKTYSAGETKNYYSSARYNMFVDYKHEPVIKKLATIVDRFARLYLMNVYEYECHDPIQMMAGPFCQSAATGTAGIAPHAHPLSPLVVTYYPRVQIDKSAPAQAGMAGVNGELGMYDPAAVGKRAWPSNTNRFFTGSVFRLPVQEGTLAAFEGYMMHDSAQYVGNERICIPTMCYPRLPNKNGGCFLHEIL